MGLGPASQPSSRAQCRDHGSCRTLMPRFHAIAEGRATTMPLRAGRAVRRAGGRGDLTYRPGSDGEPVLQDRLRTTQRARRFHATRVTAELAPAMRQLTGRTEMAFIATSN